AAVAVDNAECSTIGKNILQKKGTTVDAALAAAICNGVMHGHSMGIGGPLAIGVPGELKAYKVAYERFGGNVTWKELFEPTIKLCRDGYTVSKAHAKAIDDQKNMILKDPQLRELFLKNPVTNELYKEGDKIKRIKFADTLQLLADRGPSGVNDFYNGDIADKIVKELRDKADLQTYEVDVEEAIQIKLNDTLTGFTTAAPSSGPILAFILNILKGYSVHHDELNKTDAAALFYHRVIEAFKFAYAKRSELADPKYTNISETNFTSCIYLSDSKTFSYEHYGGSWLDKIKQGTAHLSVIGPDGDGVGLTSTVNLYFGSKVVGSETGIIYNNEMDDFSSPNSTNSFGIPSSEANFIEPGKRPVSSMSPLIILDQNYRIQQVLGASGGTKITTTVAQVMMKNLWFNQNIKDAIDAPRVHHQLLPPELLAEEGFDPMPQVLGEGETEVGGNERNIA
ncbi:unnamed protein product, partial [Didymodactylos carnosus]